MIQELYKMFHKKYFFSLLLLLVLPLVFGIGWFFRLPYITEGGTFESCLDYCANMQELIKYFYFFIVVYLACDCLAGELEEGQLNLEILYVCDRRKVIINKTLAFVSLTCVFHAAFWAFNFAVYCICNIKEQCPIILYQGGLLSYIGIFFGYLEMFFIWGALAMLIGLFFRKIHTFVITYFVWFALRYIDKIITLKNIAPEFMADFLVEKGKLGVSGMQIVPYLIGGGLFVIIEAATLLIFKQRDIH